MFIGKLIRTLKQTINSLEQDLDHANFKIENRDRKIEEQEKEIKALKDKQIDLENNIEFLVNNSRSKKIKELFASTTQAK